MSATISKQHTLEKKRRYLEFGRYYKKVGHVIDYEYIQLHHY